ncbi:MAG: GNAT family N-acetyltransferase [archaeon]
MVDCIEFLLGENLEEAAGVYVRAAKLEKPPGNMPEELVRKMLRRHKCFVYKSDGKITGLVVFRVHGWGRIRPKRVKINFIGTIETGKGIGKKLMRKVAEHAVDDGANIIYSEVSGIDARARAFYKKLGFDEYGTTESPVSGVLLYRIKAKAEMVLRSAQ